ncbi:transporter [Streptomyces salinarius]|uniref:transporter n=1 Tax=Streptomyces salinarius TaxID=2762598 RepID=UPI0013DD2662|nr:transporter [Streptomyces salinarius]
MRGTLWLAWRQQRTLIGCGTLVLLAAAALAAYSRAGLVEDLRSGLFDGCNPGPLYCTRSPDGLPRFLDVEPLRLLGALNMTLPVLVGMFWGAPLLGRDRELGTHRMILSQGVGRAQWFASRFALAALGTAALSGSLALLFRWWWEPAVNRSYGVFWYEATALTGSGPSLVAAALFGLSVGTLAGLLTRRVLSAAAWTLLVTGAVAVLVQWTHRARLLVPPQRYVSDGWQPKEPMGDKWSTGHYGLITGSGRQDSALACPSPSGRELRECMAGHGYVSRYYEANPAGDYWAFQWADTVLLGGLAVVLVLATALLLRRRV